MCLPVSVWERPKQIFDSLALQQQPLISFFPTTTNKKHQEFKENFTLLSSPSSLPLSLFWSGLWKQRFVLKWVVQTIKTDATYYFCNLGPLSCPFPIWSTAAVHVQCHSLHLLMWEKSQLTISYLVLAPPPPTLSLLANYQVLLPFRTSFALVRSKSIYCVRHTSIQLSY